MQMQNITPVIVVAEWYEALLLRDKLIQNPKDLRFVLLPGQSLKNIFQLVKKHNTKLKLARLMIASRSLHQNIRRILQNFKNAIKPYSLSRYTIVK